MTKLQIFCLDSVSDDYEEVSSVKRMLEAIYSLKVDEESIIETMHGLFEARLVDAFRFDPERSIFAKVDVFPKSEPAKIWFLINQRGLEIVEKEWREEWD